MEKIKMAICFQDEEYQRRFLKCWMHHYEQEYELHAFGQHDAKALQTEYDVVFLEGMHETDVKLIKPKKGILVYLAEDEDFCMEGVEVFSKFQEVYKIEQQIKEYLPRSIKIQRGAKDKKIVGVFSLDEESYQLPFCAMLALEHGEKEPTILLNLQMASGLEAAETFAMEDLLMAVATQGCTKNQWEESILKEKNWDYISPMKNTECLVETNKDTYERLIEILKKEFGYHSYIINLGQMFTGCMEWMNQCDTFYLLVPKKEYKSRREQAFIQELKLHGMEQLQQKMTRVEIPNNHNPYEPWRETAEKWRWTAIGDQVRLQMQEEE